MQPQYSTPGTTGSTIAKQVQIASAGAMNSCSEHQLNDDMHVPEGRNKVVNLAPRGAKQSVANVEYEFSGIAG
ncbi:MAG: hypothetical protein AB8B86_03285 [Pseudomonadales bacterium]